jgi:hypothetical protein
MQEKIQERILKIKIKMKRISISEKKDTKA